MTVQSEPGNVSPCLYTSTTSTFQEQHSKLTQEGSSDTPGSGANVGSACPGPAASFCPPTPFPTHSGQEWEQELARMALGACKYRQGVPCGLGVPYLTFSCSAQHGSARHCTEGGREHPLPPAGTGGDDTQRVEQGWPGSLAQSSPCSLLWLAGICPTPSFRAIDKSVAPCVAPHLAVLRPGCCCGLSPAASQAHPRLCGWINPSVSLCLSHCFLIPNPD